MTHVQAFLKDEQGITTVEIILILVVLISLVIIFKKQLTNLVNKIFSKITSQSKRKNAQKFRQMNISKTNKNHVSGLMCSINSGGE